MEWRWIRERKKRSFVCKTEEENRMFSCVVAVSWILSVTGCVYVCVVCMEKRGKRNDVGKLRNTASEREGDE